MPAAIEELLDLARSIALEAGELVRTRREEGVEVAATKTAPEDIVTAADRESEDLIRARLTAARPGDGFFGEESEATATSSGLTWIVDPIDGTVNYLYGIPAYAVSIAVVEGDPDPNTWRALASAVVNPASGDVFTASAGGGAYLGRQRLQVPTGKQLSLALVGTGFSYDSRRRGLQAEAVSKLIPRVRDIRRIGSAALDLCSVAAGRLDAYYEKGLKPWDHAGGALVATEAGAKVAGLHGVPASRALTIAAEPGLWAQLEPVLDELGVVDR